MKRSKTFSLLLSFLLILGLCGIALSMGFEDPTCEPQDPTSGPYIHGTFTVALDGLTLGMDYDIAYEHYNVHLVLHHGRTKHLFSFFAPVEQVGGYNLCTYDAAYLKTEFARMPCSLGVGEAFGLTGFPAISNLHIVKRDFCGTPDEMIFGLVTIRVVPPVPPPKPPKH